MSYSRRQLYAFGEPLGDGATRREVGGKIVYGGGGDGPPEKQTTVVDIPDWAKPYAKESLGKAAALTSTPYQTYGGERIAQFTPMQKQAFGRAEGQEVASQIGAGSGLAGTAGLMGLTGGYQPGQFGSQMSQYMSPYMEAVTQRQMDSAQRQADIASTQRGAQAVRAGAFGGSRQAIENAEAARALASQKGQIQEQGLQSAYDRATDMYGREQALAEQSRQAGLGTALTAAGQLGQLGQQQFGQQMGITEQQAQFGGQQRQATQDILSQQYQDFLNQQRSPYDQLSFMSSMIRGTPMGQTTTQYAPPPSTTSQLIGLGTAAAGAYGAYKGAAGGSVPSYASGGKLNLEGTFEVADGGGGLGSLGGGGMFNNMGGQGPLLDRPSFAVMPQNNSRPMDMMMRPAVMPQGGNYAAGGITSLLDDVDSLSDEQLGQMQQGEQRPLTAAAVAEEVMRRQEMREGMAQQQAMMAPPPQTTVAEEELAGLSALPAPNLENMDETTMAGGGIVAFQNRGAVPEPEEATSPFGDFFRGIGAFREARADYSSRLGRLRDRQAAAQQGIFEALTPTEKRARAEELKVIDQEIAALEGGAASPAAAPVAPVAPVAGVPQSEPSASAASAPTTKEDVDRETNAGPGGLPQLKGMQAATTSGLADLKAQVEDINKSRTDAASAAVERAKAQEAELGEFGTEQAKRLKAQEEGLKGAEDKNFNMALIEAGLAMMSGTSANAFENIGKGALVGTKAYTTGIERIQNRKEKLDEAVVALENAKRSDKRVSQERMDRLQANLDNAATANAEALYQFGSKQLDMTRQDAQFATDIAVRQQQIAATVGKKSFEERLVEKLGGGDIAKGYEKFKAIGVKPADLMGEFTDFLKANPTLAVGDQNAAMNAFMRTKIQLGGFGSVPPPVNTPARQNIP
jgi:hypothetical protein